jgi:hypothetical protein
LKPKERKPFKVGDRIVLINLSGDSAGFNNAKGKVQGPKIDGRHLIALDLGMKKNILESNLDHEY